MENPEPNSIPSALNNEKTPNCMLWPCEDADFKCEISKSEKIIRDIDRKQTELFKALEKQKIYELGFTFTRLVSAFQSVRSNLSYEQRCCAHPLKQVLEKISFKNKIYQGRAIKSFLPEDEDEKEAQVNFKNLDFKLRHRNGDKSMVAEKRFLKEIKRKNNNNSNDYLESISKEISCGHNWLKMDELEYKREKAITNATVKGQSWWTFLGSKQEIQDKINVNEKRAEETIKKCLENRSHIKCLIKKLKTIEKHVDSIESQMDQAKRRKEKVYRRICLLIKQHEEKECCCFGHLSALKNVIEVVKRTFDLHERDDLKPELEYRTEEILKMIGYRYWDWSTHKLKPPSLVAFKDVGNGKVKKQTTLEVPVRRWMNHYMDMSTGEMVARPVHIEYYERIHYRSLLK